MKHPVLAPFLMLITVLPAYAQRLDTLVDVGGYDLHFTVLKGEGTPILFESGNTFDGPPWNGTLDAIHRITGTTLITYDRSGFGKSELNPSTTDPSDFGIENGMVELETALAKLGLDGDVILVGHSYGAYYSMNYAARHPDRVKAMVLLNAHLPDYWTAERLAQVGEPDKNAVTPGAYYLMTNFPRTTQVIREHELSTSIPIIDLVAGIPIYFMSDEDFNDWKAAHREFVADMRTGTGSWRTAADTTSSRTTRSCLSTP